jgi:hypothetical protein
LTITPQTGAPMPQKSAVEEATERARANLEQRGTALPPEHPSVNQPRVGSGVPQGGQFAQSTVKNLPEPKTGDESGSAPAAGQGDRPGDQAEIEGQGQTGEETPPEGQQEAEAGEGQQQEGQEGQEGEPNEFTVLLPGRQGDEEYEFVVESKEAAERLQQLKNGYMRASAVREKEAEIEGKLTELEGVKQAINFDPVGFVVNALADQPETVDHLVLYLLTQPQVRARVGPIVAKALTDPNELRVVTAEQQAARARSQAEMSTRIEEDRIVRQNFAQVSATVDALLPSNLPPSQQQQVKQSWFQLLQLHADRYGLLTLPVHEIPTILAPHLTALGVDLAEATKRAIQVAQGSVSANAPAPRPQQTGNGQPRTTAAPNGKRFVASATKRKQAAAPSGGAGSPGPAPLAGFTARKPDGSVMSTEEALAAHRARLAKGIRSY